MNEEQKTINPYHAFSLASLFLSGCLSIGSSAKSVSFCSNETTSTSFFAIFFVAAFCFCVYAILNHANQFRYLHASLMVLAIVTYSMSIYSSKLLNECNSGESTRDYNDQKLTLAFSVALAVMGLATSQIAVFEVDAAFPIVTTLLVHGMVAYTIGIFPFISKSRCPAPTQERIDECEAELEAELDDPREVRNKLSQLQKTRDRNGNSCNSRVLNGSGSAIMATFFDPETGNPRPYFSDPSKLIDDREEVEPKIKTAQD